MPKKKGAVSIDIEDEDKKVAEPAKDVSDDEDKDDLAGQLPGYEDEDEEDDASVASSTSKGKGKDKKEKGGKRSELAELPPMKTIQEFVATMGKLIGHGHIIDLSKGTVVLNIDRISTGSLALDIDLGGGLPKGRVTELFGPESSGKTTLLQHIMKLPSQTGKVFFADEEGTVDEAWAEACGVNMSNVCLSRGEVAEVSLASIEMGIKSGLFDLVALDSVAALVPEKEFHGNYTDSHMGVLARLTSRFCRKAYSSINMVRRMHSKNIVVILTNQIRMKIGVVWGNPEVTTGGKSIPFLATVRIDLRKDSVLKDSKDAVIGQVSRYTVVKNKASNPLGKGEIHFYTAGKRKGTIDNYIPLLDWCLKLGVAKKSGAWYSFGGNDKFQGESKAYEFFTKKGPAYCNKLMGKIEKELGYPVCFRF